MARYAVFDLHLGMPWGDRYSRIWDFLADVCKPRDIVVCGGDTYEYAWYSEEELRQNPDVAKFENLVRIRDLDVFFLEGNHDPDNCPEYTQPGVCIRHGHQYDVLADSAWKRWYYRFAPWIRNFWLDTPWQQAMQGDPTWKHHNGFIAGRGIQWLEDSEFGTLVIGHCHDSAVINRPGSGKRLVMVGSLPEDGVYLDLESMEIRRV